MSNRKNIEEKEDTNRYEHHEVATLCNMGAGSKIVI
jgi:hypothetical protein